VDIIGREPDFIPTPLDIRRPSIDYLSPDSRQIIDLNNAVGQLPNIDLSTLVYNGVELGELGSAYALIVSLFNDANNRLDNVRLSEGESSAQSFILGEENATGTPPENMNGDGIVIAADQQLTGATVINGRNSVRHTDEPEERDNITGALDALYRRLTEAAQ